MKKLITTILITTITMLASLPAFAGEYVDKAAASYKEDNYKDTIKYATMAIENKEGGMGYLYRAMAYRDTANYLKAIDDFTVMIEAGNEDSVTASLLAERGQTYLDYGLSDQVAKDQLADVIIKAMDDYRAAVKKDNTNIKAANKLAEAYIAFKKYQMAKDVLDNLIAHNPAARDNKKTQAQMAEISKNL